MPREHCTMKLQRHGHSLSVPIPRQFRHALGLLIGDVLHVELHRQGGAIVIRKFGDPPPPLLPTPSSDPAGELRS